MDVAVVGGSGFIGRHLVDELLRLDHAVTVYDPRAPVQCSSVRWVEQCDGIPRRHHDALYMLAAMADVVEVNKAPVTSLEANVLLPARVFEACAEQGVDRFLFASTIWVYDMVASHVEDGAADVVTAVNPYSSAKLCAEIALRSLDLHFRASAGSRTQLTVMRYGIPYGPGMRRHAVIPAFIERLLRGEELSVNGSLQVARPFLHVRDLAAGNVVLLGSEPGTYNISGERLITLGEIITEVASLLRFEPRVRVNEQRGIDTGAMLTPIDSMRALGWEPRVSLREGLEEMIDHLRSEVHAAIS